MSPIVLDVSVAAKWFLPPQGETFVPQALALYDSYQENQLDIIVPDLFWPEFGNVVWKAVHREIWKKADAEAAVKQVQKLDFTTVFSKDLLVPAFEIASEHRRSFYDAVYVALAVDGGISLITADERLANALGKRFPVRWLGAYR